MKTPIVTATGLLFISAIVGIISLSIGLVGGAAIERCGMAIEDRISENRIAKKMLKANNKPVAIGDSWKFHCTPFVQIAGASDTHIMEVK